MPYGPDMPVPLNRNPLLDAVFANDLAHGESEEMQQYRERQRDSELRLLGTMLFQSVLLALCILLYVNWSWSHFGNAYESAIFYGFAGFSVQAAFYFVYRAMFEDSSSHRRQLKRMRNTNRRRMAQLKFEQEKAQLEAVLNQQLGLFHNNIAASMADGVITPQESQMLNQNANDIQALLAQIQALSGGDTPNPSPQLTPEHFGIDRHRVMGIPIGPKLTLNPVVQTLAPEGTSTEFNTLNLSPTGTQEAIEASEAENLD